MKRRLLPAAFLLFYATINPSAMEKKTFLVNVALFFDPWLHIPKKILRYPLFTLVVLAGIFLGYLSMCSCVVTFRSKTQKTTEKEVQLGVAGPNSEYSQSQVGVTHIHKDTLVRVKVNKDTIDHFNIHH